MPLELHRAYSLHFVDFHLGIKHHWGGLQKAVHFLEDE